LQRSVAILAASNEDKELNPDDMEAALAKEQGRQEAIEDLEKQISGPLAAFNSVLKASIEMREAETHELLDSVFKPDCNLSAVENLRRGFIASSAARRGKAEIASIRADLIEQAKLYKVTFLLKAPSDPTSKILQVLHDTATKVRAINTEYASICTSSQQQLSKTVVTDAKKMMAVSSEMQAKESSLRAQVIQLIEDLNKEVDALDAPLVDWALQPLKNAKLK
jgi:hypothetical protein